MYIFGKDNLQNFPPNPLTLLKILLFCASRYILLKWVSVELPNITIVLECSSEFELMPLEALSFCGKEEPFQFHWNPLTENM